MKIEILVLGVGGGASKVVNNQSSTSWVLLIDNDPRIVFDLGLGVTFQYSQIFQDLPDTIYISHNHTDHSGELPVLLALQKGRNIPVTIYSSPPIHDKLISFRLDELNSTGTSLSDYFVSIPVNTDSRSDLFNGLTIKAVRSKHSEECYGLMFYLEDQLILSWSADSGFDEVFYNKLFEASTIILDARVNGNQEHADFNEIESYIVQNNFQEKDILILGYGDLSVESPFYTVGFPTNKYKVAYNRPSVD